jgi:hypothetical protein
MKPNALRLILLSALLPMFASAQVQIGNDINGIAANDNAGSSVDMPDRNTIAIGAPGNDQSGTNAGQAKVFSWNGSAWIQKGANLNGELAGDNFGFKVEMPDPNTVAIGAPNNDGNGSNAGHVRVFTWNGTNWIQKGIDIDGEASGDQSGWAIHMPNANTIAIGAPGNDGAATDAGHVRIYVWNGTAWIQKGLDINGPAASDQFGFDVCMSDANHFIAGAPQNDANGAAAGQGKIYDWNGSSWVQRGNPIYGQASGDECGGSVSMPCTDTIGIGSNGNDVIGINAGSVRIFAWDGTAWNEVGFTIYGESAGDQLGFSIDMPNAYTIAAGAISNDGNGSNAGHTRVFQFIGYSWILVANDIDGENSNDNSGWSVTMPQSGVVGIGAPQNAGGGFGAGHARVFDYCVVTMSTLTLASCDSVVSPSGNYTWTTSGNYLDTITNSAGCDSLITVYLTINTPTGSAANVTACNSYTWNANNLTYTASGTYTATLTNSASCDSVLTLQLTINSVSDLSTTVTGATITANNAGAVYQWLDCNNGFAVIAGATSQNFTPAFNGNYAVELTQNGCVDTSACVNILSVDESEISFGSDFTVYPNPTSGSFTVDAGQHSENMIVEIRDLQGRMILTESYAQTQQVTFNLEAPAGVYILTVYRGDKKSVVKLVKEM